MKKAIKKTCVVLLLFALLASQVAASYSETGTLNEGTSAISAAERYLSNWAYNSYMYADKNLTLGTVLDAEVDPAKLTLATSEFMALRNDADGQENNISVAVSKMQANIQFMIDKATYFSTIRQYNGLQRTDFNTDYVVQRVDVQGNFAVIEVLENISFQYVGAEDSSFSQKEHTVSLIKVDGEWIVANVETKYDWFANEYKDTEYKISSIIAAEKQNIQAQAECSANEDSVVSAAPAEDEMVAEVLANASFARMYNKENAWKYRGIPSRCPDYSISCWVNAPFKSLCGFLAVPHQRHASPFCASGLHRSGKAQNTPARHIRLPPAHTLKRSFRFTDRTAQPGVMSVGSPKL